jgi:hypothetical protein
MLRPHAAAGRTEEEARTNTAWRNATDSLRDRFRRGGDLGVIKRHAIEVVALGIVTVVEPDGEPRRDAELETA